MMLFVLTGQKVTDFNFSRLPLHNMRPDNSNMKVLMLQNVSCPQTKQDGFDERFSILFMYCFFFVLLSSLQIVDIDVSQCNKGSTRYQTSLPAKVFCECQILNAPTLNLQSQRKYAFV